MTERTKKPRGPLYMHTLDGKPATFSRRDGQIVYVDPLPHWQDRPNRAVLRGSLQQIQRDQEITLRNRKRWKVSADPHTYGWVLVRRPRA